MRSDAVYSQATRHGAVQRCQIGGSEAIRSVVRPRPKRVCGGLGNGKNERNEGSECKERDRHVCRPSREGDEGRGGEAA